ncbi:hypothetical protein [Flavobacterium luteum]|uniref:Uncharacterized protein n=1 Tax=Flavobacterium luteum TaxID=2026654 RepID=A0A7J5A8X3_9FLAO|nr:hypothetical protein [Flavobacterium luteum]KAB1154020.1 hypothetical protein F6464_13610 [Flavobacterium luteum]
MSSSLSSFTSEKSMFFGPLFVNASSFIVIAFSTHFPLLVLMMVIAILSGLDSLPYLKENLPNPSSR